jgi:hypothetical protein
MTAREKLEKTTFDSLEGMMEAYARQAVETAAKEHKQRLDFSGASVEALEGILSAIGPSRPEDHEYLTRLWGGYLGEALRREFGGEWIMSVYPGGDLSVPTIEVQGSRLYPLLKVFRRLTIGETESISAFYGIVKQRLGEPKAAQ